MRGSRRSVVRVRNEGEASTSVRYRVENLPNETERMLELMDEAGVSTGRAVISPAGVAPDRSPACAQAAAAEYHIIDHFTWATPGKDREC